MGCDIHLRVEYQVPGETVALKDGEIKVVPAEGYEGLPQWVPAEKLTPKEQSSDRRYYEDNDPEWQARPAYILEYEDRWYTGRDYRLFERLAGVRGDLANQFWDDRGFPHDASPDVTEDYEGWDADAHTPSWQTLDELLKHDWTRALNYPNTRWLELLERMKDLAFAKCNDDWTAVRIVYWFDN